MITNLRIMVVEDQALVRGAISALLEMEAGIEVVAQAEDGRQALQLITQQPPDLVLTDIEMPGMTGIELAENLAENYPAVKIIIITTFSRCGYIRRALAAGVRGFVLKEATSDYLIDTIKKVMQGRKVIDPELAISAFDDNDPLSSKERQALRLAADGLSTTAIAKQLFLSEGTVRNYISAAVAKLNASNRIDAARIARQKGWL